MSPADIADALKKGGKVAVETINGLPYSHVLIVGVRQKTGSTYKFELAGSSDMGELTPFTLVLDSHAEVHGRVITALEIAAHVSEVEKG